MKNLEEMRFELVKSALTGSARLVMSRGMTHAPGYEIDFEDVQDQVVKAIVIARAAMAEMFPGDEDRVTCVRISCQAPIERGAVACDNCRIWYAGQGRPVHDYRKKAV